jgi:hypothetical protein
MPRTGALAVASLLPAAVLLPACGCATGGVPDVPQGCRSLDQRLYVRGAVRNPDGSPAPGLKVSVVGKPGSGPVACLLRSGVGSTGPSGDYELSIQVRLETDHGPEVLAEAWQGDDAAGSTRVRIDMRIGSPPNLGRAASGVNIEIGS